MKAHALILLSASFAAVLIAQAPGSPRFDTSPPRLLLAQVEAALSNGVPPAVLASNLNGMVETQASSLLEACLAFDFSTNDIARTADALALRVKAMQSLFGDKTYWIDRTLFRRYADFCNQAYDLASRRDMSISEKWFQDHPLEKGHGSMTKEEIDQVNARNKTIRDAFEQYMTQWIKEHHEESAYWRFLQSYDALNRHGLKLRYEGDWEGWKDPLENPDLNKVRMQQEAVRRKVGNLTKKAKEPFVPEKGVTNQIAFLKWRFGDAIATNKQAGLSYNGVRYEYSSYSKFAGEYFAFNVAWQRVTPVSHRLYGVELSYQDYDEYGPLGRYADGRHFLEEGRAVLRDLEKRFDVSLQELQLGAVVWPYRPGHKKSRMWSGPIPEAYLCDETAWVTSRHADAWSTTIAGNLIISLHLSITYYDEYKIKLLVMDKTLRDESDAEFAVEYRQKLPGRDPDQWIRRQRELELKY